VLSDPCSPADGLAPPVTCVATARELCTPEPRIG
jgi:hypothetical protein